MRVATVRETINLTDKVNAVTPYTLKQVLQSYSTTDQLREIIAQAEIDPSQIDLSAYARMSDIPSKLSNLTNDMNYISTVNGIIPSQYLPSFVDDVLEYNNETEFPIPGESGKIYVDLSTNITYRWGSSDYVEISKSLAIGTTEYTAYRGDHGLIAYEHSQASGNPHGLTLSNLGVIIDAETINKLSGLTENIIAALARKLDLTGGTLTGTLTLHSDPVNSMDAATKHYVDTAIDGISVSVTQNITRISELTNGMNALETAQGTQASTITEVINSVSGINQTTINNTSAISALQQNVNSISSTVSTTSETLTELQDTINQNSGNTIISDTEPNDTTKIWFNTTNNRFYKYILDKWECLDDYDSILDALRSDLDNVDSQINDAILQNNSNMSDIYYTKNQTDSKITQESTRVTQEFSGSITSIDTRLSNAESDITNYKGYIETGATSSTTYMELGHTLSDFKVRIDNDQLAILYKGNIVTHWEQDLFEVETIISRMLQLGNFRFINNDDGSLSFRKK